VHCTWDQSSSCGIYSYLVPCLTSSIPNKRYVTSYVNQAMLFLRKETENRHFWRYSDAKTAVYPFKVIQGYWF